MKKYATLRYGSSSDGVLGRELYLNFSGRLDFNNIVERIVQTYGGVIKKQYHPNSFNISFKISAEQFNIISSNIYADFLSTGWEPIQIICPGSGSEIPLLKYTYE